MNPRNLLALLGRYNVDPAVEETLAHFAVRNRPEVRVDDEDPDGPIVETYSWVKNSRAGIEFGFQDGAAWFGLDETEFGKHPMVMTEIYFYGEHVGVRSYQGQLPFGLELSDDRATVRKKLIQFEPTRHSYVRDTWDTPEFRITVAYTDGGNCIRFALCMLREPPLPPLGYALAPVPSVVAIVRLLGATFDDPGIHWAFDPLGLRRLTDAITETGQADFRNPYGLALDFTVPEETHSPGAKKTRLLSATFFEEREQGARTWPGELPYGIRFGDSPEALVQKLGRPPDMQHDNEDNFTGVALWHEPEFTTNVVYDTMENRVLRVSVVAPDSGRDGLTNCFGPQ